MLQWNVHVWIMYLLTLHFCARQLQNLDTEVRPYLSRWYEESVMHIHRVVQLAQSSISFLLHAVSPVTPLQFVPIQMF